jgi:SAM-dependent methyltransferase
MNADTARHLALLNAAFYEQHGLAFAETRPRLNLGVRKVLARIVPGARVLDVGCGDGKPGRWLTSDRPAARRPEAAGRSIDYLGLDASASMITRARALTGEREGVAFAQVDVLAEDWAAPYTDSFGWVLAFAVLHHVPGAIGRARLVRELAACCQPGGRVAISCWRPSRSPRLLGRVAAWSEIGLTADDVDPGDLLMAWERAGQRAWRYVHEVEPLELDDIATHAGLSLVERFVADGHAGDLADYAILERTGLTDNTDPNG